MIKEIKCQECDCIKETQEICDTCGKYDIFGCETHLRFTYGSPLDGNEYCFCSLQCLKKFVDDEIAKENE